MKRQTLLSLLCLGLLAGPVPASRGIVKFAGTESGTITRAGTTLTAWGDGHAPRWGAWSSTCHLAYDPVLGQQPGTWTLTFDDGTLFGTTGTQYRRPGEKEWVLVIVGGTGEYAAASGTLYWYSRFDASLPQSAYTATVWGYVWLR